MAKKTLGYVQLQWTCPACGTINPGPRGFCNGCGSPQPEDVAFHQADQEVLLTDEGEVARAKIGPDKHCPYCNARNRGDAEYCGACGGHLSEAQVRESGKVLGAFRDRKADPIRCPACGTENPPRSRECSQCGSPLTRQQEGQAQEKPLSKPSRSPLLFGGIGAIFLLACIGFIALGAFLFGKGEELTGEVTSVEWSRRIPILMLQDVERQDWQEQIPSDGTVQSCEWEYRETSAEPAPRSTEVCGTPYTVDSGSGYGEVVQDCQYEVYAQWCSYTIQDWEVVETITETGNDLQPQWPDPQLAEKQRLGEPEEHYEVHFSTPEGLISYPVNDGELFQQFALGSQWILELNRLGGVIAVEPAP